MFIGKIKILFLTGIAFPLLVGLGSSVAQQKSAPAAGATPGSPPAKAAAPAPAAKAAAPAPAAKKAAAAPAQASGPRLLNAPLPRKPKFVVAVPPLYNFTFDPVGDGAPASIWNHLLFAPLVGIDPIKGGPDGRFGIAKSWERNADNTVWTFYLRPEAKWQDGTQITCADVQFSVPRYWADYSKTTYLGAAKQTVGTKPDAISCPNPTTVVFRLATPNFWFDTFVADYTTLGLIVPKHYIEKVGREKFALEPLTSGPYTVKTVTPGSGVVLEAVDKYWGMPAAYDQFEIRRVPEDTTRLSMLRTGEVDAIEASPEQSAELLKSGAKAIKLSDTTFELMFFECWRDKVCADREVREAMLLAIDKRGMCKAFFQGQCSFQGGGLWRMAALYDTSKFKVPPVRPLDIKKAQAIVKRKVPANYELQVLAFNRRIESTAQAEALAEMLKSVGFKVKIKVVDANTWRDMWMQGGYKVPTLGLYSFPVVTMYSPDVFWASNDHGGRYSHLTNPEPWQEDWRAKDKEILELLKSKSFDEYTQRYYKLGMEAYQNVTGPQNLFTFGYYAWANAKNLPSYGWLVPTQKSYLYVSGVAIQPVAIK